ncbi:hypothetical protein CRE_07334 [Caenorhabditis remanei]|uniref:Uncharacterized protein n=1 Tax=Caenorhabditis remanei TaxID=31234 RepID=E3M289_CAERE|nr:hypothetical protein CRE_07334 [Caenorhabditis remanei]
MYLTDIPKSSDPVPLSSDYKGHTVAWQQLCPRKSNTVVVVVSVRESRIGGFANFIRKVPDERLKKHVNNRYIWSDEHDRRICLERIGDLSSWMPLEMSQSLKTHIQNSIEKKEEEQLKIQRIDHYGMMYALCLIYSGARSYATLIPSDDSSQTKTGSVIRLKEFREVMKPVVIEFDTVKNPKLIDAHAKRN